MKPVFSTDNTLGRKNSVFHADKFAKGNLSEATEEKLCDAEMKKLDFRLEEKIPRKNTFLRRVYYTRGTTQIAEGPPLQAPTSPIP